MNSYFLVVVVVGGGGGVCMCLCVCTCAFFHTCYTAPKVFFHKLYKDIKSYLTCPAPQSVYLSLPLSFFLFGWLVGLLVWVSERERESLLT